MNKQNYIFLGIIEDNLSTLSYIKKFYTSLDYRLYYSNSKGNIIILSNHKLNIVVISMKPSEVENLDGFGLQLDLLIINTIDQNHHENSDLRDRFRTCPYYIINSDGFNLQLLSIESLNGIVITYGFNNKASMTISSHNIEENIEASLCLQREIVTLFGERVSPLEFIVEIDSKKKDDIYSVLAISIFFLLLGEKIQLIKNLRI